MNRQKDTTKTGGPKALCVDLSTAKLQNVFPRTSPRFCVAPLILNGAGDSPANCPANLNAHYLWKDSLRRLSAQVFSVTQYAICLAQVLSAIPLVRSATILRLPPSVFCFERVSDADSPEPLH